MTDGINDWTSAIHTGDCLDILSELPASSVHMCMTSPPYFGLRDYGVDGQIGLEDSLDEYISKLVAVGDGLRRVLRDDGSWWLNLGDSYAGSWGAQSKDETKNNLPQHDHPDKNPARNASLGRKNKMFVPHRVAIALQEAGWVVRNDVTWVKPNPMPHSVKDRLITTTEQVFHLVPKPDYWYDLDEIREPHAEASRERANSEAPIKHTSKEYLDHAHAQSGGVNEDGGLHPDGKNPGDVFEINTRPFPDAHFAVYPPELCEKPIKATAPPKVCAECGSPYGWRYEIQLEGGEVKVVDTIVSGQLCFDNIKNINHEYMIPTCDCDTDSTESGIVLDPFAGAGTTLLKAKELGRRFLGIELKPEYADMARARVGLTPEDPARVRSDDSQRGLEAFADGGTDE